MSKIYLKRGREDSLKRFHPWIFSGAIGKIEGNPEEGDVCEVIASDGEYLGAGHFQRGSIAVRMLCFDHSIFEESFWRNRFSGALKMREKEVLNGASETNAYRLVHGEGDMLPGLIIDYYDGVAVMQAHSAGMFHSREPISNALREVYGSSLRAVYDKSSTTAPFKAGLNLGDGYIWGESLAKSIIKENGHLFMIDWEGGQKTGFFLDQRVNRMLVKSHSEGKRVLNLFCYTGGFSIYSLAGGAKLVDSVDSSKPAVEMLEKNISLNREASLITNGQVHNSFCTDAIEFLRQSQRDQYDMIIVDPPAFAKHRDALQNALRAYQRLNYEAISKVSPGGVVFTYSCSQVVDRKSFTEAVFSAAARSGREVRIIGRLSQPTDHPVSIYHPEGEYLKGLVLYVE